MCGESPIVWMEMGPSPPPSWGVHIYAYLKGVAKGRAGTGKGCPKFRKNKRENSFCVKGCVTHTKIKA